MTSPRNNITIEIVQVTKGCGIRSGFEAELQGKAKFDSARECYVTDLETNNRVINNNNNNNNIKSLNHNITIISKLY